MSEQFDEHEGDGEPQSARRKYMIIGIVLAVIAAIAIPTYITVKARSSEPVITLETIDARLTTINTNLDGDVAAVKADVAWVKEKLADLITDGATRDGVINSNSGKLTSIELKLVTIEAKLATLEGLPGEIDILEGYILSLNTTVSNMLVGCNCTCGA